MSERFLTRFSLVAILLISLLMFSARDNLNDNWQSFLGVLRDFKSDISESLKAEERAMPLSTAVAETQLALYIGEPFKGFSRSDWQDFWRLIYGRHFMPNPRGRGWPHIYRQLSLGEIRVRLIDVYVIPFARFSDQQWGIFLGIALKQE